MNSEPDLLLTTTPAAYATPHRFLWLSVSRTAILSDIHLGAAAEMAAKGLPIPDVTRDAMTCAWTALIARQPAHVIIAGDLFDSPRPALQAVDEAKELFSQLPAKCRLTLLPGNHDPANLATVFSEAAVVPSISIGTVTVSHGHALPDPLGEIWITGHQHPAVIMATRVQSAKMACYAICEMNKGKKLILLPAFSRAPLGSNLLTERNWLLPVPRPDAARTRIVGLIEPAAPREPQVLDFGPLSLLG